MSLLSALTSQDPQLWSPSWLPGTAVLGSTEASQPEVISTEGRENAKADGEVSSVLVVWWKELWLSIRNQVCLGSRHPLAVGLQTSPFLSLCLCFLICKMGLVVPGLSHRVTVQTKEDKGFLSGCFL